MKKYIFFIRSYNDWDNISPIIYYLGKNCNSKIYICFYRMDLTQTYVFHFLKKEFQNRLIFFFWEKKRFEKIIDFVIRLANKFFFLLKLKINISQNINVPDNKLFKWIKSMDLQNCKKLIVIFDRISDPFLKKVKDQLKGYSHVFISCPHGPRTDINRMTDSNQIKLVNKNQNYLQISDYFDHIVYSDYLEFEYDQKYSSSDSKQFNVEYSKISVLGSIRYCPEWLDQIDAFTPQFKKNNNKKKAVFFMTKYIHNVFPDEVYRTIDIFSSYPEIDFYIVPHTRGMKFSLKINAKNIHIGHQLTSNTLINMADIILFYGGTSIILEPLVKKKLVACVNYLDCNINIYDFFDACHILKCRDDLCLFIESVINNKFEKANAEKLINEIVYARDQKELVSERYINFFKNL